MNSSNLDIKFRARKLGIPETALARYFHKSYSWLMQNLRCELKPKDKRKYFKAIDVISANRNANKNNRKKNDDDNRSRTDQVPKENEK